MDMKQLILGITGGIAAYKSCSLVTGLRRAGHSVHVVMTEAATEFVSPLVFESLSANPVHADMFEATGDQGVRHIELARNADLFVIAPCTANAVGKLANGIADDMLTTTALAVTCPTLICPAMNHHMYLKQVVQQNLQLLRQRGCRIMEPEEGRLASGDMGTGRLPEPETILERIREELSGSTDLEGVRVLVTAGPTREHIDPVRFLSNPSTGRMGFEVAREAVGAGAEVTLVTGPTSLQPPAGVEFVSVISAEELASEVIGRFPDVDVVVMAAAVADYTPAVRHDHKFKKEKAPESLEIQLKPTKDVLHELGQRKEHQLLVGFAAESQNLIENARAKLQRKKLDLIAANDITEPGSGFGGTTNRVSFVDRTTNEVEELPLLSKREVARRLLTRISTLIKSAD